LQPVRGCLSIQRERVVGGGNQARTYPRLLPNTDWLGQFSRQEGSFDEADQRRRKG